MIGPLRGRRAKFILIDDIAPTTKEAAMTHYISTAFASASMIDGWRPGELDRLVVIAPHALADWRVTKQAAGVRHSPRRLVALASFGLEGDDLAEFVLAAVST